MAASNDEEELGLDEKDSLSTKHVVTSSVNILNEYCKAKGSSVACIEKFTAPQLNAFLRSFFGEVKRSNGELYAKRSMITLRYGLQKHFKKVKTIDIVNDSQFKQANEMYQTVLMQIKLSGKGCGSPKDPISKEDFLKIKASSALNVNTPRGLQNKVFVDLMLHLCNNSLSSRRNLRSFLKTDFAMTSDSSTNQRYVYFAQTKDDSGRMYETCLPDCPVAAYCKYTSHLDPANDTFWQRPKNTVLDNNVVWYNNMPLGKNTLGAKMHNICREAGTSKIYTNSCLRATTIHALGNEGFAPRHIMSISGHKSEASIKHYVQRSMSLCLSDKFNNSASSTPVCTISPTAGPCYRTPTAGPSYLTPTAGPSYLTPTTGPCYPTLETSQSTHQDVNNTDHVNRSRVIGKVQSSELSKKAKLDHGTTVTDEQFKNVLSEVSLWYDRRPYINWLKVLYQDHVASNFELDNATKMIELLNLLIDSGDLSPSNLTLIYDTIKATKQFGLVEKLKRLIPSCPNVRDIVLSKFSCHRQQVVMLGMVLRQADVAKISECYNDPVKEYVDVWNLIMDLEHRRVICEGKMESFIEKLKTLQVPLAVEALTKGNSETSSLATTSTKSNSGEVMPNNRDESSTTSMTSNSDQVMSKDPNESTKFNQMVKTSVKRKVQSSELSKKAKLDHESSNDLVIGSSASEDSSDYSDYDDNDDVDYDDDDIAVNNDLNKEMPSGQTAGSPQQPPCRTPYTNEPSTHGQPTCELPVQQTAAHCLPVAQQPPTHCLPVAQQPPTDFLPVAQQPPTHCLPVAQQPPTDFLPVAQQQPMDWLPVAQQPSMDYLPVAQQPPTQCLPVAQQRPIHCLPVAQESPVQEKLLNVKREVESDESSQNLVFLPVKSEFGNLLCSEEEPFTEIIEEPKQRDFRFYKVKVQYEEKSISKNKSFPTIQVNNYTGSVRVVVSLVTNETGTSKPIPHPYGLVGKDCENGICKKFVPNAGQPIKFEHLGVQRIKQDEIFSALLVRLNQGVNPFKNFQLTTTDRKKLIGLFDLTVVCLCFQVYLVQEAGETVLLAPVVSQPIFDKNYPAVIQIDRRTGFARGGDKVFILCSKIQRDDIAVKFFDADWSEFAQVNPSDIHRRVAIVCTTPPYKDGNITEPKQVYFKLIRPSDNGGSQAVSFTYIPNNENFEQKS